MDHQELCDNAMRDLQAAVVTLSDAGKALRQMDILTERQRRDVVAWLDDLQTELNRTGQIYQRLNERSMTKSPLNGAPSVIMHEERE